MRHAILSSVRRIAHRLGTTFARTMSPRGACLATIVALACGRETEATSSLAERARSESTRQTSQTQAAQATKAPPPAAEPTRDPIAPAGDSAGAPAAPADDPASDPAASVDAPVVELRLALDPSIELRATTVGMVQLPVVDKPTAFAMQEALTLHACEGEGAARRCRLEHRFTNFEAEPPAGRFLENDHVRLAALVRTHPIAADGRATAVTEISGEGSGEVDDALRSALASAHLLHCIRFPTEPVKVGATWTDTCDEWARGAVGKRDITWTLARVDHEEGVGRRAELRYRGTLTQPSNAGDRTGTVQGVLYFYADIGQPHLLREQLAMPLKAGGATTKTTLNIQFARVDPRAPDELLRVDGRPFPEPPPRVATPPSPEPPDDPSAPAPSPG